MPNFAFATKNSRFKDATYDVVMSCYGFRHLKKQSKTMDTQSQQAVAVLENFIKNCPQQSMWSVTKENDVKTAKPGYFGEGFLATSKKSFICLATTSPSMKFSPIENDDYPFNASQSWNLENIEELIHVLPKIKKICENNRVSFNHRALTSLLKIKKQLNSGELVVRKTDPLQDLGESASWVIYLPNDKKYADHRGYACTLASARLYESKEAAMKGLERVYQDAVVVRTQISVQAIEHMQDPNSDISPLLEARSLVERQDIEQAMDTNTQPTQNVSQKRKM